MDDLPWKDGDFVWNRLGKSLLVENAPADAHPSFNLDATSSTARPSLVRARFGIAAGTPTLEKRPQLIIAVVLPVVMTSFEIFVA